MVLPAPLRPMIPTTSPAPDLEGDVPQRPERLGRSAPCSTPRGVAGEPARSAPRSVSRNESPAAARAQAVGLAQLVDEDDGSAHGDGRPVGRAAAGVRRCRRTAARSCGSRTGANSEQQPGPTPRRWPAAGSSRACPGSPSGTPSMIPHIGLSARSHWYAGGRMLGRVDHRADVHQDLDQERDDVAEVAVEDRQGRAAGSRAQRRRRASARSAAAAKTTCQLGVTP